MNYKTFGLQEADTYYIDETKAIFDKRNLENMLERESALNYEMIEEKKKQNLREDNLKHQEIMKKIHNTKKKALAFAAAIMVAGGALAVNHADKVMSTNPSIDYPFPVIEGGQEVAEEQVVITYDDFVKYRDFLYETTGIELPLSSESFESVKNSGELESFVKSNLENGGRSL